MGGFAIAPAQLAALFMQSIAYGVHMVTFAACMYTWFRRTSTQRTLLWMAVAVAFFAIGTCDVAFNFYHNLMAFIDYQGPGGADAEFNNASNWVNVMRSVWFYINAALSDAVLIYRCWIVYSHTCYRSVMAIVPMVLWLLCVTCAIMIVYYLSTLHATATIPEIPQLQPFLYSFYVATLVLNVLTTGLIIGRLWKIHKHTAAIFTRNSRVPTRITFADVILIMVESALLYTTTVVLCIVLDLAKTNVYYGVTDISLEVAGISFDLIIIRIWRGVSAEQTQGFVDMAPCLSKFQAPPAVQVVSAHSRNTIELNALALHVVVSPNDATGWPAKERDPAQCVP